jgi:hypothetical protein
MPEDYNGNNEGREDTDINVFNAEAMNVFVEMMRNSTPPPANDLQPLQKRLPMTYRAILNGHGDYGYGRNQRAFMTSPQLAIDSDGCATLTFPELPRSTTRVVLQGRALASPICLDVSWHCNKPQVGQIDGDAASQVQFIEAYDNQDTLLAIGIPTTHYPTSYPAGV